MEKIIEASTLEAILQDRLFPAWDKFPESTPESTMLYNYSKLMLILLEKEMEPHIPSADLRRRSVELGSRFGDITATLHVDREAAMRAYRETEEAIGREMPGLLYFYTKQWGISVSALYYYKEGQYERAFAQTLECIAMNEYLVRSGVHTLLFRMAEQNRNLARVLFKMGKWDKGAELSANVLAYLLNGNASGLYGHAFEDQEYWNLVPYVREGYAYEYFRGLVAMLIRQKESGQNEKAMLFDSLFGHLEFDIDTPDRLILYNWIYLKKCYYRGDYAEFIEEFITFMEEELCQVYDVLKMSLFQDMNALIRKTGCTDKDLHLQRVRQHLDSKLHAFGYLKSSVDKKSAGNHTASNNDTSFNDFKIAFPGSTL